MKIKKIKTIELELCTKKSNNIIFNLDSNEVLYSQTQIVKNE